MEINNSISEYNCSFEVSKLLKEKGYLVSPNSHYYTENGVNGLCSVGGKVWQALRDGIGPNIISPTHALAMKWIRINLNWHFELIWDIENGEKVWFYGLTQIGDLDSDSINTPQRKTPEEAAEDALLIALGKEPVDPNSIKGIDYEAMKNTIVEEYQKGNIVVSSFEGLQVTSLEEFVKQPVEGMLYDLNRNEAVVLTFIKDPKWINDYAVCKVIQELKRQLDEKNKDV